MDNNSLNQQLFAQRRAAEEVDAKRRAAEIGAPYLDLVSVSVPTEIDAMQLVPEVEAREALIVPLQLLKKKLTIAALDTRLPKTLELLKNLKDNNYELEVFITSKTGLDHAWDHYQFVPEKGVKEITGSVDLNSKHLEETIKSVDSLQKFSLALENVPTTLTSEVLEFILSGALALKSSDIHLEPNEKGGLVRLRLDGVLKDGYNKLEPKVFKAIITRLKLLSGLKINLSEEPQDGRFTFRLEDREIEVRLSIIPSEYGQTAVLRILDPKSLVTELTSLGFRPDDLNLVEEELKKPDGLILNTGPTGSGKTTTLYAFLQKVRSPEIKIITVEDPIEYRLSGISQTQVDPEAGYTFASGLRSILRQDPDVILIGEIRDGETAEIGLNAALTGHMVFSTLHTNDAVGAIPRLLELGSRPQSVGPALSLVIAQRLVRRLCTDCKKSITPTPEQINKFQEFIKSLPARVNQKDFEKINLFEAVGCEKCHGSGYKGRVSIFELFHVSDAEEEAIYKDPTEMELKRLAKSQGMVTMQEDGVLKTIQGTTTFNEVERLTGPISWLSNELRTGK
jgi:type II secretory ATPase GspE/PulE/Tfp pilus assembly ATPase PilB-like protein